MVFLAPAALHGSLWTIGPLGPLNFGDETAPAQGEGPEGDSANLDLEVQVGGNYLPNLSFPIQTNEGSDPMDPFEVTAWNKTVTMSDLDGLAPWDYRFPVGRHRLRINDAAFFKPHGGISM
jgi:hypothetical protein